jgi:hypothetical protein
MERETLRVVDTDDEHTLTTEDISELKRLARLSRTARWVAVSLLALGGAAVGAVELYDKLNRH